MSHVISISPNVGTNYVVDLRRTDEVGTAPTGPYYKACKLKVTSNQDGGAAAKCIVAPIIVADDASPPTPAGINVTTTAKGVAFLDSTLHPSVEMGQSFGPGYTPQVFREIVATHLMITPVAAGVVEIVVD